MRGEVSASDKNFLGLVESHREEREWKRGLEPKGVMGSDELPKS